MPGEPIIFTGSSWTPGEAVTIVVDLDGGGTVLTLQGTADNSGVVNITGKMPDSASSSDPDIRLTYTATATGSVSDAPTQAQFAAGHAATDAERMIDQETYWNHRLTYPTGNFNPGWVRKAAAQDRNITRGVPHGRARGNKSKQANAATGKTRPAQRRRVTKPRPYRAMTSSVPSRSVPPVSPRSVPHLSI